MNKKPKSVDEYISGFPSDKQKIMESVRSVIRKSVPDVEETISYNMPAYKLNGKYLVYFAGYDKHIGFYPLPSGMEEFKSEFSNYKTGKGSIQFPIDEPMPLELIKKIVEFRKKEAF